ncbi:MAG TPA: 2-oxo acid dehydrogenase subunit E2 [candidate division Zixibacteria bacterium]|nr:2-oxo acid dehydrogenase subunit E2 [candidate division Zixibacteria bacterium]
MPRRQDGELLKTTKFHELEFHIMPKRSESIVYFKTMIDLTYPIKFLEEYNKDRKEEDKVSLFQLYLAAGVRTITLRPKLNRFISGRRLWQRNQIIMSFVVLKNKKEEGEEVIAVIEFDPFDTLDSVQKRIYKHIYEARYGESEQEKIVKMFGALPRFVIRFIAWFLKWTDNHNLRLNKITKDFPFWSTAFVAHLGSLDTDAVYHHFYDIGTISLFFTLGKMHQAPVVNKKTGEIEAKTIMEIKASIDERISAGSYLGPTIDLFKELIENPESLLKPPELTNEQLDKLMLKKYKKERLAREKLRKKQKRKSKSIP